MYQVYSFSIDFTVVYGYEVIFVSGWSSESLSSLLLHQLDPHRTSMDGRGRVRPSYVGGRRRIRRTWTDVGA